MGNFGGFAVAQLVTVPACRSSSCSPGGVFVFFFLKWSSDGDTPMAGWFNGKSIYKWMI